MEDKPENALEELSPFPPPINDGNQEETMELKNDTFSCGVAEEGRFVSDLGRMNVVGDDG